MTRTPRRRATYRGSPYLSSRVGARAVATAPNQVWTWDITKLKGPVKWSYFYLYVILDLFSRLTVGWTVAPRESAKLAELLIAETMVKQGVDPGQVTLHADRGPSQTAKSLTLKLADLGVTKSHSRPYNSNDNPFSEAQFKTLKCHPTFPARFGSIEDARRFAASFFTWYNTQHRHSSLALLTPADVHYGRAEQILEQRAAVLCQAFEANPQRFKSRMPTPGKLLPEVWINPPPPPIDVALGNGPAIDTAEPTCPKPNHDCLEPCGD